MHDRYEYDASTTPWDVTLLAKLVGDEASTDRASGAEFGTAMVAAAGRYFIGSPGTSDYSGRVLAFKPNAFFIHVALDGNDVTNYGDIAASPYRSLRRGLAAAGAFAPNTAMCSSVHLGPGTFVLKAPLQANCWIAITGAGTDSTTLELTGPITFTAGGRLRGLSIKASAQWDGSAPTGLLAFTGGSAELRDVAVSGGAADTGGCVYVNTGDVMVRDSSISNCEASSGGCVAAQAGATLSLRGAVIQQCRAAGDGGGVVLDGFSTLSMGASATGTATVLSLNTAVGNGGGIRATAGCTVSSEAVAGASPEHGAVLSNNAAGSGGAVYASTATLTFHQTRVADNTASGGGGGGIVLEGQAEAGSSCTDCEFSGNSATASGGAALVTAGASLAMATSALSANSAGTDGGGIIVFGHVAGRPSSPSSLTLTTTTLRDNTAPARGGNVACASGATLSLLPDANSVIAGGQAGTGGGGLSCTGGCTCSMHGTSASKGVVAGNTANEQGGGIYVQDSSLVLTHMTVRDNEAKDGVPVTGTGATSTPAAHDAGGGGLYAVHSSAAIAAGHSVQVSHCVFSGNTAAYVQCACRPCCIYLTSMWLCWHRYGGGMRIDAIPAAGSVCDATPSQCLPGSDDAPQATTVLAGTSFDSNTAVRHGTSVRGGLLPVSWQLLTITTNT